MKIFCAGLVVWLSMSLAANAQTDGQPDAEAAERPGTAETVEPGGTETDDETVVQSEPPMTLERLGEIIRALDPEAEAVGNAFQLRITDVPVVVVTDPSADRMRAMVPIRSVSSMEPADLLRVMQANFDTALDARYAIAQGRLWGVFIHPLSPLEKNQLISGLGQAVNLATTYGTLYTGGAMTFRGGDSAPLQRKLIDDLLKKGEEI